MGLLLTPLQVAWVADSIVSFGGRSGKKTVVYRRWLSEGEERTSPGCNLGWQKWGC